jgi:hypothetical protein
VIIDDFVLIRGGTNIKIGIHVHIASFTSILVVESLYWMISQVYPAGQGFILEMMITLVNG